MTKVNGKDAPGRIHLAQLSNRLKQCQAARERYFCQKTK